MNLYNGWFFVVSGSSFSSTRSGVWPPNCWKLHMSVNFLVLNSRNFLLCSWGLQIMVVGHMECLHSQEESNGTLLKKRSFTSILMIFLYRFWRVVVDPCRWINNIGLRTWCRMWVFYIGCKGEPDVECQFSTSVLRWNRCKMDTVSTSVISQPM